MEYRKGITYRQRVLEIGRLRNSRNGNARFRVTFTGGSTADTAADSSYAYEVENLYDRDYHGWVAFEVNGRGKITKIEAF